MSFYIMCFFFFLIDRINKVLKDFSVSFGTKRLHTFSVLLVL